MIAVSVSEAGAASRSRCRSRWGRGSLSGIHEPSTTFVPEPEQGGGGPNRCGRGMFRVLRVRLRLSVSPLGHKARLRNRFRLAAPAPDGCSGSRLMIRTRDLPDTRDHRRAKYFLPDRVSEELEALKTIAWGPHPPENPVLTSLLRPSDGRRFPKPPPNNQGATASQYLMSSVSNPSAKSPPHSEAPASTADPMRRSSPSRSLALKPPAGELSPISMAGEPV